MLFQKWYLCCESDDELRNGKMSSLFVDTLLALESTFLKYLRYDDTPECADDLLDRLIMDDECVLCNAPFDFSKELYGTKYRHVLQRNGLHGERLTQADIPKEERQFWTLLHFHHRHTTVVPEGHNGRGGEWVGFSHENCEYQLEMYFMYSLYFPSIFTGNKNLERGRMKLPLFIHNL